MQIATKRFQQFQLTKLIVGSLYFGIVLPLLWNNFFTLLVIKKNCNKKVKFRIVLQWLEILAVSIWIALPHCDSAVFGLVKHQNIFLMILTISSTDLQTNVGVLWHNNVTLTISNGMWILWLLHCTNPLIMQFMWANVVITVNFPLIQLFNLTTLLNQGMGDLQLWPIKDLTLWVNCIHISCECPEAGTECVAECQLSVCHLF